MVRLTASYLLVLLGLACSSESHGYVATVSEHRARKDAVYRHDRTLSPIEPTDVDRFLPLLYYDIDEAYAVPAQLETPGTLSSVEMPTSTGELRPTQVAGVLKFNILGQPLRLTAFLGESGGLFVPFADQTSGDQTYGGGRYLDIEWSRSGIYLIDFNLAYTPSCYYNPRYSCPFPPHQNRLPIAIQAGERVRPLSAP